jgi:hypothetical protein
MNRGRRRRNAIREFLGNTASERYQIIDIVATVQWQRLDGALANQEAQFRGRRVDEGRAAGHGQMTISPVNPTRLRHVPIEPSLGDFCGDDIQRRNRQDRDDQHGRQRNEPEHADEWQIGYGEGQRNDRHG